MIQIEHLTKTFTAPRKKKQSPLQQLMQTRGIVHAVNDISFTCKQGSVFSLVGRNSHYTYC